MLVNLIIYNVIIMNKIINIHNINSAMSSHNVI